MTKRIDFTAEDAENAERRREKSFRQDAIQAADF
jgi:hypothetical protein